VPHQQTGTLPQVRPAHTAPQCFPAHHRRTTESIDPIVRHELFTTKAAGLCPQASSNALLHTVVAVKDACLSLAVQQPAVYLSRAGLRDGLRIAAHHGRHRIIELLLRTDYLDKNAGELLIPAVTNGDEAAVRLLLSTDKCDSVRLKHGLSIAASKGNEEIMKLLLRTDYLEKITGELLILAVANDYEALIRLLLDSGKINRAGVKLAHEMVQRRRASVNARAR
jgi:hypothetical protein